MDDLTPLGQKFKAALQHVQTRTDERARELGKEEKIHVVGAGRTLTAAYEQLRNAAEYTEEDLLLQRAIRRFYKRLFMSRDENRIAESGEELIIELTLAGYIPNNHIAASTAEKMSSLATSYYAAYRQIARSTATQPRAEDWSTAILAVEVEGMITDHGKRTVFAQFAYEHFSSSIDKHEVFHGKVPKDYEVSLLVAVYRGLLKADGATIRHMLLERYQQTPKNLDHYIQTNKLIDKLLESEADEKLIRVVSRRGAPLRVLRRVLDTDEGLQKILDKKDVFLDKYETQITTEYRQMNKRIDNGIMKSVIFLIITKFAIGISIEVPYDYMFHGHILWLPLAINLLFPPVYMILLRLTLALPSETNTRALTDRMENLMYESAHSVILKPRKKNGQYTSLFNSVYGFVMVGVFALVTWILWTLGFSALHLLIFFVFLSTASFLGFRLSRMIREIEAVDTQQSGLTLTRDFLYFPFVVVGRWMSEKYSKVNIVALTLDMMIELPLKTVIRLVQQWGAFINSKKDEL